LGAHLVASENDLHGLALAHGANEALGATTAGNRADGDFGLTKLGPMEGKNNKNR
jgi:hypothetical protein